MEIRTCIIKNGAANRTGPFETTCDSLIVTVSAADIGELRFSKLFDQKNPIHYDTLSRIPSGTNRTVRVFTIDRAGDTIHIDSVRHTGIKIDPSATEVLNVVLIPSVGSIYVQVDGVPSTVDSVFVCFATDKNSWGSRAKQSGKMFFSIDKIPHNTRGVLTVSAVSGSKDTLYSARDTLTFNACKMETITLVFTKAQGGMTMAMTIALPGVTSASGNMTQAEPSAGESGELVISEIMYAANDSEYVEVYNPAESDRVFDTLYLTVDGKKPLAFANVTVGGKKTFVIGRISLPWCAVFPSSANALELTKNGNRITLGAPGGKIIDRVFFTGGANALEWPKISDKRAMVLDKTINDARLNDFGRNWLAAETPIDGFSQYGTPGIR